MFNRKSLSALGIALALSSPFTAVAADFWQTTNDEAGTRIVNPVLGVASARVTPTDTRPLVVGSPSRDRQYVYGSEEGGWQLRPMQYRFEQGRLVHVDDPAGHMSRLADTKPATQSQRDALARSGGR